MRIVQTFWTAGKNPLEEGFGWAHADYSLMSWSLSCHSLRKNYGEVALYTDTAGKEVLIDKLHLPYTEVHVVFDDFHCLPQHWALAKVKTYSLQTRPFLHIDGDVYVPRPFSDEIINACLVAQNREIGTSYYRRMMDEILSHHSIHIPDYILIRLKEESIGSYNMGIFGGCDLSFIHSYCDEAFRFMEENQMNNPKCPQSAVWCNIFFEQMILAAKADEEGREVKSVLGRPMKDEGYSSAEFCDLSRYEERQFFHFLGGHKGGRRNCELLMMTLLRLYPDTFRRILALFPRRHLRLSGRMGKPRVTLSVQMSMAQYEDFLESREREWSSIPLGQMERLAMEEANYVKFLTASEAERRSFMIYLNHWMNIFEVPTNWHEKAKDLLRDRLRREAQYPMDHIAMIPSMIGRGVKEVPVVDIQKDILNMVEERGARMTWGELYDLMTTRFTPEGESTKSSTELLIFDESVYLLHHGLLLVRTPGS